MKHFTSPFLINRWLHLFPCAHHSSFISSQDSELRATFWVLSHSLNKSCFGLEFPLILLTFSVRLMEHVVWSGRKRVKGPFSGLRGVEDRVWAGDLDSLSGRMCDILPSFTSCCRTLCLGNMWEAFYGIEGYYRLSIQNLKGSEILNLLSADMTLKKFQILECLDFKSLDWGYLTGEVYTPPHPPNPKSETRLPSRISDKPYSSYKI